MVCLPRSRGSARRARAAAVATAFFLVGGGGEALALPVISELFYDAAGSDDGSVFVELYGEPGTPLEGFVLEGVNGANGAVGPVLELSGSIPEDGVWVVADLTGDGLSFVAEADLLLNFDFQNGPDSVVLRWGEEVVDAVGYGEFGLGEVFAGEGMPAPDAPAGSSLARLFADVDTDDNELDFEVLDTPTPGFAPLAVPEPATALPVLAALALLRLLRREPRSGPSA